jgi:hypothetical protein
MDWSVEWSSIPFRFLSFPPASSLTESGLRSHSLCLSVSDRTQSIPPHYSLVVCPVLSCPVLSLLCFAIPVSLSSYRVRVPTTTLVLWCVRFGRLLTLESTLLSRSLVPRSCVFQVLGSGGSDGHETTCSATRYREARGGRPLIAGIKRGRRRRSEGELEPMPTRRVETRDGIGMRWD